MRRELPQLTRARSAAGHGRELEHNTVVGSAYFFAGREPELRALIHRPDRKPLDRQLRGAACRGTDPDDFHPDEGRPDQPVVARCTGCPARLACLALALRAEEPDMRCGWYGGLGPDDRDRVAGALGLVTTKHPVPDRVVRAAQLKVNGWTVEAIATELGCSRRTVQRYLHSAA